MNRNSPLKDINQYTSNSKKLLDNILIVRADASNMIGIGHVMRCIALAQAWKRRGGEVFFIGRISSDKLKHRIVNDGFEFIAAEHQLAHPDDIHYTLSIIDGIIKKHHKKLSINPGIGGVKGHWIVLDGYHFSSAYQKKLQETGCFLLVIDDLAHLPHYYADILLNQNINAKDYDYRCSSDSIFLLGSKYALIRSEFIKRKIPRRIVAPKAKNILVTFGGADSKNMTSVAIRALKTIEDKDLNVKIFFGPENFHTESLRKELTHVPFHHEKMENTEDMPSAMVWSDLAITAAGSTCWELSFMGVPSITIVTGSNQMEAAEILDRAGIVKNLGWWENVDEHTLTDALRTHIGEKDLRQKRIQLGQRLIDGRGAEILTDIMHQYPSQRQYMHLTDMNS